jgi:hypothetical protein
VACSAPTTAIPPESPMTTSEEWAVDIVLERLKAELADLLREHSAKEVAAIMAERRRRRTGLSTR